jgi:DNA polymerase III subunit delta
MPAAKKATTTAAKAKNLFAVTGSDEGRVKEAALRLVQQHSDPGGGDFSNEIIDGTADNADGAARICRDVCIALQTLPFFGKKVVWLKTANFLGDSVTGRAQDSVAGFEAILSVLESGLPDNIVFILSATAFDKRRAGFKRLDKLCHIEQFDKPDTSRAGWEGPVITQASLKAKELGIVFESGAIELLVQLCGDDTRQLENELEKIHLYLGDRRRAGIQTVRQMVSMSRAAVIWDLGNAIGARDLPRTLKQLGTLLSQGQNAVGILLAAIVPKIRNLLIIKDLLTHHRISTGTYNGFLSTLESLPAAAIAHLPKKKDGSGLNIYPLFLALGEASRFTLDELRSAQRACLEANLKLVTTQLDERMVLERLLIGMLGSTAKAKPSPAYRR